MLSWLSVRQNRLTALPESIADCVRLKTLYLKDNDLCILPLRMAELSLGQLSLANNPRLDLDCVGSHPLVSSLDTLVTANNGRAWWRRVGRAQVLCIASALQSLELPTLVLLAITDQYDVSQQQVTMFLKWSAISLVRHFLEKQRANQESHQEAKVD